MTITDHRHKHRNSTLQGYKQIYDAADDFVKNHMSHDVVLLDDFCTESGYPRRSVQRALSWNSVSWSSLLRLRRMTSAQEKLVNTSDSIDRIARQVGYRDENAFSEAFNKFIGLTPEKYREVTPRGR